MNTPSDPARPTSHARPHATERRRIVHVSDLHFGSEGVEERAEAVLATTAALRPDVIAVSGDLTKRARPEQFRAARRFLDRLEAHAPVVVVPGNHDVPLQPFVRFRSRLARYRRYVHPDPQPFFTDGHVALAGLDTTRAFAIDGGRARRAGLARLAERLADLPTHAYRVVVAHHPFARTPGLRLGAVVQRADRALAAFEAVAVDAVLWGHRHETVVAPADTLARGVSRAFLLVQAGTATTRRGRRSERGQNTFMALDVAARDVTVTRLAYDDAAAGFAADATWTFARPA